MALLIFLLFLIVGILGAGLGYYLGKQERQQTDINPKLYRSAAELLKDMINLNVVTTDEIPMLPPAIRTRVEDWLEDHRKHHERRK